MKGLIPRRRYVLAMTVTHDDLTIEWLGYATVRIEGDSVVYVDPGRYGVLTGEWESSNGAAEHPPAQDYRPEDGDVVCITHRHHYDPEGIRRVAAPDATIVTFEGIDIHHTDRTDIRPTDLDYEVRPVGMEENLLVDDMPIWTVPAYNDPEGSHTGPDGTPFHQKGRGCGFVLALDGTRVFLPGDTDALDGHAELSVDVFVPPIGGAFTMDRHEAADLAAEMAPDLVVPVHYNTFEAIAADAGAFAADLRDRGVAVKRDETA